MILTSLIFDKDQAYAILMIQMIWMQKAIGDIEEKEALRDDGEEFGFGKDDNSKICDLKRYDQMHCGSSCLPPSADKEH